MWQIDIYKSLPVQNPTLVPPPKNREYTGTGKLYVYLFNSLVYIVTYERYPNLWIIENVNRVAHS